MELRGHDPVNHPDHYTARNVHCSCGNENSKPIECIDITRHFNFNLGNAIKYIWRSEFKGNQKQDLQKAIWYLQDQIKSL